MEDAPALKVAVNPLAPIEQTNLHSQWLQAQHAKARSLVPLVVAGKNLSRSPVVLLGYGSNKGKLLVSQLLTHQRLNPNHNPQGLYQLTFDPAAVQWVLNGLQLLANQ